MNQGTSYPNWPNNQGGGGTLQTLSISGQDLTLSPGGGTVTIPVTTTQPVENLLVSSIQIATSADIDRFGNLTTAGTISAGQNITSALAVNASTMGTQAMIANNITANSTITTRALNVGVGGANISTTTIGQGTISTLSVTTQEQFGGVGGTTLNYGTPNANSLNFYGAPVNFSTQVNFLGNVTGIPGISTISGGGIETPALQTSTVTTALMNISTMNFPLSFEPNFNPSVEVNLGDQASQYLGKATLATGAIAVVVSGVALATGVAALANSRTTAYINSNVYETVNGTTQLQISTLGTSFSTIQRFTNSSNAEVFVSTIYPPGQAIRSFSDPLYGVSTPTQCFQSFGQWVSLPTPAVTIPTDLSTNTLLASNYISTTQARTSTTTIGGVAGFGGIELSLADPISLNPVLRAGVYNDVNTDGYMSAQGFNWTYPGQAKTNILQTDLIPYNNQWRIATKSLTGQNILAFLTDFADPQCSTITVQTSSIIAGVKLENGVITTPAEIKCFAVETLNVKADTAMETGTLTTSTITNNLNVSTNTLTVIQNATIPNLSTNQVVLGDGYVLGTGNVNPPYLSTINQSTMSLWGKSPLAGGDFYKLSEAPLVLPSYIHAVTTTSTTNLNSTLTTATGRTIFRIRHTISNWNPLNHTNFATTGVVRLATSSTAFWYWTYSVNSGAQVALGGTSATSYYIASGTVQFLGIAGLLENVPLANGDVLDVYVYGYVPSGTHTISNTTLQFLGTITPCF